VYKWVLLVAVLTGCGSKPTVTNSPATALKGPVYCFSASVTRKNGSSTTMEGCTPDYALCARAFQTALSYSRFVGYVKVHSLTTCRYEER
jgi:hypothetical protein